jgi:hypothetical protein
VTAGFGLDPAALQETADGINATISELKTLGIDEGAELGRGFSGLSLTGMQVGHAGLQGRSISSANAGRGARGRWCRTATKSLRG